MKSNIGRVVFGLIFLIFGAFHFIQGPNMTGMVPAWLPGSIFWVYSTGVALAAAGVSIIINKKASLASLLLALLLLSFALLIHLPGALEGDQSSAPNFLKDTGLAAAAIFMSGVLKD